MCINSRVKQLLNHFQTGSYTICAFCQNKKHTLVYSQPFRLINYYYLLPIHLHLVKNIVLTLYYAYLKIMPAPILPGRGVHSD